MVHKTFCRETEVKVPPKRLWTLLTIRSQEILPLLQKDTVAGIDYEGEKGQPGCIRIVKFHKSINGFQHVKERIEEVDHEKLRIKMSVIEGGLAAVFKDVKIELEFKEGANADTTIAKSKIEYEAEGDIVEIPEQHVQASLALLKNAEAYLLQHNDP